MSNGNISGLEKARLRMQERRDSGEEIVIERLDPLEKAKRNPNSRKLAINAKCYECQGCNADPAVKWRIGNCEVEGCPLHPFRPYQNMLGRAMPVLLAAAMFITSDDGVEIDVDSNDDDYEDED